MIIYKVGNLLEAEEHVLAHGVNASGGFGAGIAAAIGKKYPLARKMYLDKFEESGWSLGEIQTVICDGRIVINCCTQQTYGRAPTQYVNYDAIAECMDKLFSACKKNGLSLALPKIGAGLGGGDWDTIAQIIDKASKDNELDVSIYILSDNEKPKQKAQASST